ncbi:MAG: sigma-70 family RNA polymerase sigma factor [Planctomycetaceae bacterium]
MASNSRVQSTDMFVLNSSQQYLRSLCERNAPGSLLAEAWEEFYRVYDDLIRRFAIAQGLRDADLDDCVQDVWNAVAASLFTFEHPENRPGLRAWLFTLVRSKATNILRSKARSPARSLDQEMIAGQEPGDPQADPAKLYEQQWEQALLDSTVSQLREELSPSNARILQMRLIDHRSVDEVARELNLTPEQVHARQYRVMKKLRTRLALYTGDPLGS